MTAVGIGKNPISFHPTSGEVSPLLPGWSLS